MSAPESERIRWVRYACDCAERVVHLAGSARPQAEAAIRAAREWADAPSETMRRKARGAASAAYYAAGSRRNTAAYAAGNAAYAAGNAAHAADAFFAVDFAAAADAFFAVDFAAAAAFAAADRATERAWQAERRKYYGLPEVP